VGYGLEMNIDPISEKGMGFLFSFCENKILETEGEEFKGML
jgi:hypothetical protein